MQEENKKLKSENREIAERLEVAEASQAAFRSQVSSLKEVNTTQKNDIRSLRAEAVEARDQYNQFVMDSNTEKAVLRVQVSVFEVGLEPCLVADQRRY